MPRLIHKWKRNVCLLSGRYVCAHCTRHVGTFVTRHNPTQPLENFSTRELCALATHLKIKYCAEFFEQVGVDGKEMLLFSKEEFVSMLKTSTGNIFELVKFDTALWLKLVMHLSHAGVYNAKALKAWNELQPYLSSSKLTDVKKRVRAFCIVLWDNVFSRSRTVRHSPSYFSRLGRPYGLSLSASTTTNLNPD